ncbi:MAG: VWA domain-containing protein [Pirellulales bacterium]
MNSHRATKGLSAFAFATAFLLACGTAAALAQQAEESAEPAGVYQDNVVIVLDASGSMNTPMANAPGLSRMQAAKQALLKVTESLPTSTNVGLLVFSSSNLRDDWAYRLGPVNHHDLQAAIKLPEPGGATPLGVYLKKGADTLLAQRQEQRGYGTYRLLVVTDGEASDPERVQAYFPEVLARGVTVDVIGVDMSGEHTLAQRANSYRKADNPESLERAVSEVFAEVGSSGQQDSVDAEQFAMIQGLPTEVASAMLAALTETGNEPIGESPNRTAASPGSAAPSPVPGQNSPAQNPAQPDGGGMSPWKVLMFVVLLLVVRMLFRGKRTQQRTQQRRRR